jgi:7-cyano-7-deazaguanine reductase
VAPKPGTVGVRLVLPEQFDQQPVHELDGLLLDRLDIECTLPARARAAARHGRSAGQRNPGQPPAQEQLPGHRPARLGQRADRYSGPQIDQERLLQYIVSFRNHNEFHEQCVERIFMDIWRAASPSSWRVCALHAPRRAGHQPLRTSHPQAMPKNVRTARQ